MNRCHMLALAAALLALVAMPAQVSAKAGNKAPSTAPAKPAPKRYRRIIHAIELAASKKEPFRGAITLALVGTPRSTLTYYWGGQCKGTRLQASRVALLFEAMRRKMAVEIPSRPIRYAGRVHMCMRSIRVLAD